MTSSLADVQTSRGKAPIKTGMAYDAERKSLEKLFRTLPANEREFIQPLLENAAFMRVTLDELQKEIQENGAIENYQNGANQRGVKISANIQAYNQMVKAYHSIMGKLLARLPSTESESDMLNSFRLSGH